MATVLEAACWGCLKPRQEMTSDREYPISNKEYPMSK
jgi:hypothetical protein